MAKLIIGQTLFLVGKLQLRVLIVVHGIQFSLGMQCFCGIKYDWRTDLMANILINRFLSWAINGAKQNSLCMGQVFFNQ